MDGYENMFKTICRLCLSTSSVDKMFSLIDNSSVNGLSCFGKAINMVTNVFIQKDDILPTMLCQKCIRSLKQTIYFKLKCESVDQKLKELVAKMANSDAPKQNIQDILCEYVLYSQYFSQDTKPEPIKRNRKHKQPVKKSNSIHETDQKSPVNSEGHLGTEMDLGERLYDFDDYIDKEDFKTNITNQQDDNSAEINSILDAMQSLIDSDSKFSDIRHTGLKVKKEQRHGVATVKERNLVCKICHKVLANPLTYKHHMERHNNCKYICDQCGKGFPVLTEMHIHQVARHGVGPHLKCDHCPYKAPRKLELIEHIRIHTGERPFTCETCGLTFRRRAIWRNHLVCHMEKQFQCTQCPKRFYRQSDVLAHSNNVHQRMYMFVCSVCDITYARTATVRKHMLVKHGIPRDKQGKIKRVMNTSAELGVK